MGISGALGKFYGVFVLFCVLVWASSCAESPASSLDAAEPEYNSCMGQDELLFQGESASPGQGCGPCEDGVLLCDGTDQLVCEGATELNACGGCHTLVAQPDTSCGACGQGVYTCQDDGTISCEGAAETNACGGCGELDGAPGTACDREDVFGAIWRCASPEETRCVGPNENACAGSAPLNASPLEPCGDCMRGVIVCDGADAVRCQGGDDDLNACGGCAPLRGEPAQSCGTCAGEWVCAGEDDVLCDDGSRNACGGCVDIGSDTPGESCGENSIFACRGPDTIACVEEPTNACGGSDALDALPGEACGPCGTGHVVCASPNTTACLDARELNACDGCGLLPGEPGESCSPGGTWQCSEAGTLECRADDGLNACGGTQALSDQLGDACGPCGLDVVVCDGSNSTTCSGQTACPVPTLTASQGDFTEFVRLSWTPLTGAQEYVVLRDDQEVARVDANGSEYDDTGADAGELPMTLADPTASQGDFADRVELQWQPPTLEDGDEHSYRLVAVYPAASSEPSAPATGYRAAGTLTYQWERSGADSDANYSDLAGASGATHADTSAPADGSARYYRLRLSTGADASEYTSAARGFRAALAELATNSVQNVGDNSATLHAQINVLGAPAPTSHGFCFGQSSSPAHGQSGVTCTDLGPTSSTGGFSQGVSGLNSGTTYYVRAYATTNAGTAYGNQRSFTTTQQQYEMSMPPFSSTFSGSAATRGYWFQAPVDFKIVGLRVPDEDNRGLQNVEVVRFNNGAPPDYSANTNDFVSLTRHTGVSSSTIIDVDISVSAGDVIGVLGAAGSSTMYNSYASSGAKSSTILGQTVTLTRMGMQYNLATTSAQELWQEPNGSIARVEFYYAAP